MGFGGSLLRDLDGLLFDAVRGCSAGTWAGLDGRCIRYRRGHDLRRVSQRFGSGDDAGELLAESCFGTIRCRKGIFDLTCASTFARIDLAAISLEVMQVEQRDAKAFYSDCDVRRL